MTQSLSCGETFAYLFLFASMAKALTHRSMLSVRELRPVDSLQSQHFYHHSDDDRTIDPMSWKNCWFNYFLRSLEGRIRQSAPSAFLTMLYDFIQSTLSSILVAACWSRLLLTYDSQSADEVWRLDWAFYADDTNTLATLWRLPSFFARSPFSFLNLMVSSQAREVHCTLWGLRNLYRCSKVSRI